VTSLSVVTPSYAPDFPLFRELHASVLTWTDDDVIHHVVVPRRDVRLFSELAGPRCRVLTLEDVVPRRMLGIPGRNVYVNVRRPFPPIRGWVMQQLLKLDLARTIGTRLVLLIDSDIVLVRPVLTNDLIRDNVARFYRKPDAVHAGLERHLRWHATARELLGLPPGRPPFADYISSFMLWDATILAALKERIELVTGRPWLDAVGSKLHVSEWTLYGVFVDHAMDSAAASFSAGTSLCHSYWESVPLTVNTATDFLTQISEYDLAVMIHSKSGTPLTVRQQVLGPVARGLARLPVT
jgi:Family of unknown function (DUF6492)